MREEIIKERRGRHDECQRIKKRERGRREEEMMQPANKLVNQHKFRTGQIVVNFL